jgi:hypothetical protein
MIIDWQVHESKFRKRIEKSTLLKNARWSQKYLKSQICSCFFLNPAKCVHCTLLLTTFVPDVYLPITITCNTLNLKQSSPATFIQGPDIAFSDATVVDLEVPTQTASAGNSKRGSVGTFGIDWRAGLNLSYQRCFSLLVLSQYKEDGSVLPARRTELRQFAGKVGGGGLSVLYPVSQKTYCCFWRKCKRRFVWRRRPEILRNYHIYSSSDGTSK